MTRHPAFRQRARTTKMARAALNPTDTQQNPACETPNNR